MRTTLLLPTVLNVLDDGGKKNVNCQRRGHPRAKMNDNVLPCAEGKGRTTFFPVPKSGSAVNGWPAVGPALSFIGRGTVSARAA